MSMILSESCGAMRVITSGSESCSTLQHRRVHRVPLPTFVTIAKRPSRSGPGGDEKSVVSEKTKEEKIYGADWTRMSDLKVFRKKALWRSRCETAPQCPGPCFPGQRDRDTAG